MFPALEVSLVSTYPEGPYAWDPETAPDWLAFLERHPEAFDVIEILDDIVLALHQVPEAGLAWLEKEIAAPLLERARALVESALAAHGAECARVPWVIWENRPALRLIVNLIYLRLRRKESAEAVRLMEWMVYTLNPNDNHGLRDLLSKAYLELGRDEEALRLAGRYREDHMAAPAYNRVLALYRLGRLEEAGAALRVARARTACSPIPTASSGTPATATAPSGGSTPPPAASPISTPAAARRRGAWPSPRTACSGSRPTATAGSSRWTHASLKS